MRALSMLSFVLALSVSGCAMEEGEEDFAVDEDIGLSDEELAATPYLLVEYAGCDAQVPEFIVSYGGGGTGVTYETQKRIGTSGAYTPLTLTNGIYRGANKRRDSIRVRACDSAGCSAWKTRPAYANCAFPPQ
jgi:hypothetical protein